MKTMKKLMAMLMMVGMVFAFPACGSDDDDEKIQDPNGSGVVTQQGKWTESGDKMTYTYNYGVAGYNYQEKWIFTMKDGVCTGIETQVTCPTEELAKLAYEEYKNDPDSEVEVTRKGKVLTIKYVDDTSFVGMDKATLKMVFESMYGGME